MIVIAALFVVMFFSVPRIFLAVEPKDGVRPSLDQFMANGTETLTGHNSGKAALVEILTLPVALTVAILAMGIAAAIISNLVPTAPGGRWGAQPRPATGSTPNNIG